MRLVYSALVYLLRPAALAVGLWRALRDPRYRGGFAERLGYGPALPAGAVLWIHAVSLGEVSAAAPLIRALRERSPAGGLVLTTATPTGRARARELFGDAFAIRYLPYDTPGAMRRFTTRVRPCAAIIMETELWPNLCHECRRRGIPVVLASARLTARSVQRYVRFGRLFREAVAGLRLVAAQTPDDACRFIAIGAAAERTRVVGNVKFDVAVGAAAAASGRALRSRSFGGRPIWIAGSTHPGEEDIVLAAHAELAAVVPGVLLLLAPRHPERFASVAGLLRKRGVRFASRSGAVPVTADTQVLLVDTVGELASLYAAADIAFVGGSLVPVGGHNLLEPAALGVPVVTGPHQANAREIAQLLLARGAARQVADAPGLTAELARLFGDPAERERMGASGRAAVDGNRGSVARLLEALEPILETACRADSGFARTGCLPPAAT